MSWETRYEQWVAWVDEEATGFFVEALDAFDDALRARLEQTAFPSGNQETVVSSMGNGAQSPIGFDGMTTVVRPVPVPEPEVAPTGVPETVRTQISGELEVALASPPAEPSVVAAQLEVELQAPGEDGLYIPTLTRSGATPPGGIVVTRGQTVIAPAPTAPHPPPAAPSAVSPSEATPPEPVQVSIPDPPPSAALEFVADQSAASSQTAGEIVMLRDDDDFDPGSSISSGKIVINTVPEPEPEPAVELAHEIHDLEDEEEDEPDELDASDLVEEEEPPPPPQIAPTEPPPTPPPARFEVRPPPTEPSLATRAALADLQAEAGFGPSNRGPRAWYEEVFDDHYAALVRPTLSETAAAEARFFVETAGLAPGAHVLDMGCGQGAHALALAKQGFHVTGVDLSLSQLLRASQAKDAAGVQVAFLQGDMRDPPIQGPFEGVLCVGSSIGYFTDEENLECLRRMHGLLTPGGKLMLEVFNRDHIISRLPARSWWQGRGCLVLDEAQMDYFSNRLQVHRTAVFEDGRQFEHRMSMRAYAVHELVQMCASVGLRVVEISGSRATRGRFFGATSPDIWLLAERPAQ